MSKHALVHITSPCTLTFRHVMDLWMSTFFYFIIILEITLKYTCLKIGQNSLLFCQTSTLYFLLVPPRTLLVCKQLKLYFGQIFHLSVGQVTGNFYLSKGEFYLFLTIGQACLLTPAGNASCCLCSVL